MLFVALFVLQLIWLRIHIECSGEKKSLSGRAVDILFVFCTTLAVASLFRLYPGNARAPIQDSSAFLYIGERMAEGKRPYLDLFDHKGPLLYLIQWTGICMTPGSFTGVWLLEVLNIAFTTLFMLRLAALLAKNHSDAYLAVLAVIGACGWMVWQGGNFTEEFALPWISSAAWVFCSFFETRTYRKQDILLLGAGFAAILLLRANMVAVWVSFMPIVLVLLLKERRFSDLGKCTVLFACGFLLIFLPIMLWSACEGFFLEMWEDYILFNFRYTGSTGSFSDRLRLTIRFITVLWPAAAAAAVSLLLHPRRKLLWYNLLFFAVSAFTAAMSGRLYYHYAIVILPAAVLPFSCCFDRTAQIFQNGEKKKNPEPIIVAAAFCLMLAGAMIYRGVFTDAQQDDTVTAYLKEKTEPNDDVLIIGNSSWYYLLADRKTENRFFYQLPPVEISETLRNAFYNQLLQHPSDYIVLPGVQEDRDWMNEKLGGLRKYLESEAGSVYRHETSDEFEVYIRQ